MTESFSSSTGTGISGTDAAEKIAEDQIDILVVIHVPGQFGSASWLTGLTIQVAFEVATTGMAQIDYRFTDRLRDTPNPGERWYVERPAYLPGFDSPPAAGQCPFGRAAACPPEGVVTFACFNNSLKITAAMLGLWAQILAAEQTSRLLEVEVRRGRVYPEGLSRLGVMNVDPKPNLRWKPAVDHLASV